jgi:hypothetical protein
MKHWASDPDTRLRRLRAPKARRVLEAVAASDTGITAVEAAAYAGVGASYAKDILAAAEATELVTATPAPVPGRKGRPPLRYKAAPQPAIL